MSGRVQICPKCDGEGYIMDRGGQIAAGLITFGMFPLMDAATRRDPSDSMFSRQCPVCKGHGKFINTSRDR